MSETFSIQSAALIRDTFREAMARKIFWGLFALSTLMVLFVWLILRIDVVEGATATVSLFGIGTGRTRDVDQIVRGAYSAIATFLYTFGMFLAVFASSGLVPNLLEPGRIELLLSKPVGRAHLLLGRFTGNLLIVLANTVWLVGGVWLVFGIKTGVWGPEFLFAIPSTVFLFMVLLTVVTLVGVAFESAALSTMITVALMIVSPILAQERIVVKLLGSEWSRNLWKGLYHSLPKVYDIGHMTLNVVRQQPVESWTPVLTSCVFAACALGAALYIFEKRDF